MIGRVLPGSGPAVVLALASTIATAQEALPAGLVYLRSVDPTIEQDIRYATSNNFTGAVVPGYDAGECILTARAAQALKSVQQVLRAENLALRVFDCYRPQPAVAAFVRWVAQRGGRERAASHPRVDRRDLVKLGYIAAQSGHSRGDAVDLTLIHIDGDESSRAVSSSSKDCAQSAIGRSGERGIDMGTAFDCFDLKSHTSSGAVTSEQRRWRTKLVEAMEAGGFSNYPREWWHFTLRGGDGRSYGFPIKPLHSER